MKKLLISLMVGLVCLGTIFIASTSLSLGWEETIPGTFNLEEVTAPDTPSAGYLKLYAYDGRLRYKDDSGTDLTPIRTATLVVAANNSSAKSKAQADYVCDGTADNVEIQAAITALPALGGTVSLLEGTYNITATITIDDNTRIIGMGYSTLLESVAALDVTFSIGSNIVIEDLRLKAITAARTIHAMGIYGISKSNITVRGCWFDDFVYNAGSPGGITGSFDGLIVQNCVFLSANGTGNSYPIYLHGSEDIQILGNRFTTAFDGNCIYTSVINRITIVGNHMESTDLAAVVEGIDIEGVTTAIIANNTFYNLSIDGILIGGNAGLGTCVDITIVGNNFRSCGKTHIAKRAGVSVGTAIACDRIEIHNNTFYDCNASVRIGEAAQNLANIVHVGGNRIESCSYPFILYGNNYEVYLSNNICKNNTNPIAKETGLLYWNDLAIVEQRLVGRITGGDVVGLTAAQIRTLINVENGSTADQTGLQIVALLEALAAAGRLDADAVEIADAGAIITATDVEGALQEIQTALDAAEADIWTTTAKARVHLSAPQLNIANTTYTKVLLNVEDYDPGDNFASNRFVALVAGYYQINACIQWSGPSVVADKQYAVCIYKNGANYSQGSSHSSVADYFQSSISDIIYLDATDFIEMYAYHNAGVNTVDIHGAGTSNTWMSIHLLSKG